MSGFVLDASVAAVWLLDDESDPYAEIALQRLEQSGAIVPQLWHCEIRNCLLVAERRKRLTADDLIDRLDALSALPIQTDSAPNYDVALALSRQ